jgi:hypothetical protein
MSLTKDMPKEYKAQMTMKAVQIADRPSLVTARRGISASDPGKSRRTRSGSRVNVPAPLPSRDTGLLYLENEWTFWFDEVCAQW